MRPRESPASPEAFELLKRAQSLLEKTEELEKGMKGMGLCPECGEKKMDMEKGMCMKAGCMGKASVDMKKGDHHKAQSFDFNPGHVQFMSETGGQTFNAYYTTNQSLLDSEDVANKGATSQSVNLEPLNARQNPHDNPAPGHQTEG
jgi:hypothetical protein